MLKASRAKEKVSIKRDPQLPNEVTLQPEL
jgi:hypothetical protein